MGVMSRGKAAVKLMALQKLAADAAVVYISEMDCPAPDLLERSRKREELRKAVHAYQEFKHQYERNYIG